MNSKLPKVLVVGINAWREDGDSQTLMDIFRCWDPERLALVYTRADLPNTPVCNHYFQISEGDVLKSVFKPWISVGREAMNNSSTSNKDADVQHARYAKVHKHNISWLPLARECVWKMGHWKSNALKKFVLDFNPDIIFVPIYPVVYMGWIQRYIIKLTKKPTVCYLADDNYSYDSCKGVFEYMHRAWLRSQVGPIARNCNEMFVIVEKEKEDTDSRFGTDSVILTKSIDFSNRAYKEKQLNTPLKFVYTGSMVIGRDVTLAVLADAINEANEKAGSIKAELYIYSQTEPKQEILSRINSKASHFCGRVNRSEVQKIQEDADVVVFAESLIGKEANAAKLSFSTKITDYLSNGKCVLAIGKEWIAPMDYFIRNDSAIIATTNEQIVEKVCEIVGSPELVKTYSRKAYDCAVMNHEMNMINDRFIQTMLKVK